MEGSKSVVASSSNIDSFAIWVPVEIVQARISLHKLKQIV